MSSSNTEETDVAGTKESSLLTNAAFDLRDALIQSAKEHQHLVISVPRGIGTGALARRARDFLPTNFPQRADRVNLRARLRVSYEPHDFLDAHLAEEPPLLLVAPNGLEIVRRHLNWLLCHPGNSFHRIPTTLLMSYHDPFGYASRRWGQNSDTVEQFRRFFRAETLAP